ncbi:MAG TPA: Fe-S-containing hydro-lyase [Synergistales bacterium]|jgi:fumarate hydratase subunit beta|nr:Fe-S-containing hydro-lyase [Synergistales bacterium]HRV71310.1 Fe-S-containing hydro-lyase [Thermovirgaceae bacterium]
MMVQERKIISVPLSRETALSLYAGDRVLIDGNLYTGRDAAHRKMFDSLGKGDPLPFDIEGQIIYYVGPSPAPPGKIIGSAGPTTSGRMDPFTPALLDLGLRGMIGKGYRSEKVIRSMVRNGAVYFGAVGGAAALIARSIIQAEVVAWPELGPEAVFRLKVRSFPAIVVIDAFGNDVYRTGPPVYRAGRDGGES